MFRIRDLKVFDRIKDRFMLEELDALYPVLSNAILPTSDADEVLANYGPVQTEDITSAASSWVDLTSIPSGERWKIYALQLARVSGDRVLDGWSIGDGTIRVSLASLASVTSLRTGIMQPFIMEQNQVISVSYGGSGSSDGTWRGWIWRRTEKSF